MSSKARLLRSHFSMNYDQFLPAWKHLWEGHGQRIGHPYARGLLELLDYNGFDAVVDSEGNIVDVTYGDDLNDYHLDDFLTALAPYVEHGSFLKFLSEYNVLTLYTFTNGAVAIDSTEL